MTNDVGRRVQLNGVRISKEHHTRLCARAEADRRAITAEAAILLERAIDRASLDDERRAEASAHRQGDSETR